MNTTTNRTKKVFDKFNVAHLWANKVQIEARTSTSNLYFRNETIYSFGSHFPIAKHTNDANGNKVCLFTLRTYSNTTAKHIGVVHSASNHLNKVFCYLQDYFDDTISMSFKCWQSKAEQIAENLMNCRKPEKYLNQLEIVKNEVEIFCKTFNLAMPVSLQSVLNISNKDEFSKYNEAKQSLILAEEKRKAREAKKKFKQDLEKWKNGEISYIYNNESGFDYLRIDNDKILTTQRVEIPLDLAKMIYNSILNDSLKVGQYVLSYEVLSVGNEIKIGCHNFSKKYLLEFGSKLV